MEDKKVDVDFSYFYNENPGEYLPTSDQTNITVDALQGYPNGSQPGQYNMAYQENTYLSAVPSVNQSNIVAPQYAVTPTLQQSALYTYPDFQQQNASFLNQAISRRIKQETKERKDFASAEAYSEVYSTPRGLCVLDKNRREHTIFPLKLGKCIFVEMDPLFLTSSFYFITFEKSISPLIISKKDFSNQKILVQNLESHFKEHVSLSGPKGKIYPGIQSLIATTAAHLSYPFYLGWHDEKGDAGWKYNTRNGSTHGVQNLSVVDLDYSAPVVTPPMTAATKLTAGIQFAEIMGAINDKPLRHLILGIIHVSSLYSLFAGLGYRIPFGFCLSSSTPLPLDVMDALLSWFHDRAIQLSEENNCFSKHLIERKDQPALVRDAEAQIANSRILEQAIKTGIISNGKNAHNLYALPIALSQLTTHLSKSSELIHIDLSAESVSPETPGIIREKYEYFVNYLQDFNHFVQEHQVEFAANIASCLDFAEREMAQKAFSKSAIQTLAAFSAADFIAKKYYQSLSPYREAAALFDELFDDGTNTLLLESLEGQICQESNEVIAELFFYTANQMIQDGRFDIREFGSKQAFDDCPADKSGIVYIHNNAMCFTVGAYDSTVKQTGYKPGTVKQALSSVGAFKGSKTNANAYQTRIRGYNPATGQGTTPVYMFSSDNIPLPIRTLNSAPTSLITGPTESRIQLKLGRSTNGHDMVWYGIENCHVCVTGRSGTGKSYFLKKAIAQLPSQRTHCIIFDTSGEFSRAPNDSDPETWKSAEVTVVDMRETQVQKIFFRRLSDADTPDIIASRFSDTLTRRFNFGRNQQDFLFSAIKEALEKVNSPVFSDLIPQIPYLQVQNALGRLNSILPVGNRPFDWKFDTPGITVLNFQNGSDDAARGTALELLLSSICAQQMNIPQDDYPSVVLAIDECQLLKWKEGSYAYDIMVRGRKYGLSMWLSTQTLSQIDNPTIPEQADLRVFFKPADSEISRITRNMCIEDKKKREQCKIDLSNLVCGQFLCKLNGQVYISIPPERRELP